MNRFFLLCTFFLLYSTNLIAEEFVPKHASFEKDGKKIELKELSYYPVFYADYYPSEGVVKIKSSAGNLILKKGIFFYGYSGKHKGLVITVRAYIEDGKLVHIVYEEFDELNNMKATINYYKR